VDKWVVMSYMARHALHEGTFRKYHAELSLQGTANAYLEIARDVSQQIMDEGGFSIYNTGKPMEDYGSLFHHTDLDGVGEIILGTFNEYDLLNSGWWGYTFGNYEVNPARDLLQTYLMTDGKPYTDQTGFET